jgi:DNA processing protein
MSSPRLLSDLERLDWLRLSRSENVGPITFYRLIERFGSAKAALDAVPDLARQGGRRGPIKLMGKEEALAELQAHAKLGARLIAWGEPDYPPRLAAIEDAPPLISVLGAAHLLRRPMVAVVGSRNASINGRRFAKRLGEGLAKGGLLVASGMARGIDGAAHEGALAHGTAAVLAGGVDHVYPPEHAELYAKIAAQGVVVGESPPGTVPQARHFPRRNRIISGMALGVVIVEAAPRSGSLITARMAADQGREVFAVPGFPDDPRAQGPNRLIRDGARLITSAEDVIEDLSDLLRRPLAERRERPLEAPAPQINDRDLVQARAEILVNLGSSPVLVDEIIRQCQLSPPVVATVLLELELAGRLERHPGNRVALLTPA